MDSSGRWASGDWVLQDGVRRQFIILAIDSYPERVRRIYGSSP
jgi:hypothetical protein